MTALWHFWLSLPTETKILIAGTITTYLVDLARATILPRLDGRHVHYLTGAIAAAATILASLTTAPTAPTWLETASIFAGTLAAAVGLNELKRSRSKLGQNRVLDTISQHYEALENGDVELPHRANPHPERNARK